MNDNNASINLFECLGIVFIILKLCKVINWSWLWVLSPIWIPIIISIIVLIIKIIVK